MGLDPSKVPEKWRKLMDQDTRKILGTPTQAECDAKHAEGKELELQEQMAALCRLRNLFFRQMPPHRKSPWPGWTDFIIALPVAPDCLPRMLMVEAKAQGGELTDDQKCFHKEFSSQSGGFVYTVWNLKQFKDLLDAYLK